MRSEATGTLSVIAVRVIAMGAAARGLPPPELCARFRLDPSLLADVDARVPVADVVALWNEVPRLVADDDFGLHLAELAAAGPQSLGGQMIAASPTLGEGLRRILRFERIFHDVRTSELVLSADEASIVHDTRGGLPLPRHAAEFGWAWLVLIARRVTGASITPRRVAFGHPAPPRLDEHARILGARPSFGAEIPTLVLARADLDRASTEADAALAEILDSHARGLLARLPASPELTAQVRAAALEALTRGELSVSAVARRLGLAPRTLQRRLAAEHALHHFRPADARAILADAHHRRQPIAVVEATRRSLSTVLGTLLVLLFVLLLTPRIRPFSIPRLFFTYVLPVIPLLILWEGLVSCLRSYRPSELLSFTAGLDAAYTWDAGTYRHRGMVVTYLISAPLGQPPP